jgi:hypothetical protein
MITALAIIAIIQSDFLKKLTEVRREELPA